MKPRSPSLVTLVVMIMATTLSLNMFLPGLPAIARDFGVSYAVAGISVGGYLAVTAVLSLVIGPMSDRFGRRPVALGVISVFALASLGAALAPGIVSFLAFRLLQGVMVGGFILASAIVRDTRTEGEVAKLLSFMAAAMALAPMLGPMLGGLLQAGFGWRASFWLYVVIGGALLAVCLWDLTETRIPSDKARGLRGTGQLLASRRFLALAATIALSTACFYTFLAGLPIVATRVFGMGESALGVALGSITLGFMAGSLTSGRITARVGIMRMVVAGRVATVAGLAAGVVACLVWPASPIALLGATFFIGIGNGLSLPNANAAALSIHPELAGSAAGLAGASTVGAGAIFTTLAGWVLSSATASVELVLFLLVLSLAALAASVAAARLSAQPR